MRLDPDFSKKVGASQPIDAVLPLSKIKDGPFAAMP